MFHVELNLIKLLQNSTKPTVKWVSGKKTVKQLHNVIK